MNHHANQFGARAERQTKHKFQNAILPVVRVAMWIVLVGFAVAFSVNAQSGFNNWSEYKKWCESQNGIAYPNPPRCIPRSSSGSDNSSTNGEAEAARKAEERRKADEEAAAEAEQQRIADEKRLKQEADQKAFIEGRDEAARGLKGSKGITATPNGPDGPQLRGSGSGDPSGTELRGSRTDTNIRVGMAESAYFYALQTRTLTPMADGGHPIDAPGSPPVGLHGLVGGTTWTYGFQRPHVKCEKKCQDDMKTSLDSQLGLYCSSQGDPKKCLADGLPFTPDMYDLVVSMGSSHSALDDMATRVLFDGATFGEFSRQNKEIFASLKGRQFDTLDCHSNGAMLCLAALRSGDTAAKEVRLFGPQINPQAAKRWQEYAANTGTTIKIYINNGDPAPALSWKQPTPQTLAGKAATAVWLTNPVTGPATFADALFNTYLDSKKGVMDASLRAYGFQVIRNRNDLDISMCKDLPSIDCHSMKLYETRIPKKNTESIPK